VATGRFDPHLDKQGLYSQGSGCRFDIADDYSMVYAIRIGKYRDGSQHRDEFLKQPEVFAEDFRTNGVGYSGDVSARPREACDWPVLYGIVEANSNNGKRLCGILGGQRRRCSQ
jgi:hypothetical protein